MLGGSVKNLILSLYVPALFISLGMGIVAPILPLFAKSFDVSYGLATLVVTATGVGRTLVTIPGGMAMDRIGRKPIMLIGAILAVVSGLLSGLAQSFYELVFYRVLSGAAMGMWMGGRQTMVADAASISMRGRVMSSLMVFNMLGLSIGPAVGGFVAEIWGMRAPFFLYAIASLLTLILTQRLPETKPSISKPDPGAPKMESRVKVKDFMSVPFFALSFANIASHLKMNARNILIPFFATSVLGLGLVEVGVLLSVMSIFGLVLALPAGILMDKFGRKTTLVPSLAITAASTWLFPFVVDYPQALYASILMGIGSGVGAGALGTITADISPIEGRGLYMSVVRFTGEVSAIIGPLIAGFMVDMYDIAAPFFFFAFLLFISTVTSQGFLKETLGRKVAS